MSEDKWPFSRKGALLHMAPEAYRDGLFGWTSDIYSLGIVMFKLLNHNRFPFLPAYPEPISFQDMQLANERRYNGEKIPYPQNASQEVGAIVTKACSYLPEDRYQSASEMLRALEGVMGQASIINISKCKNEGKFKSESVYCSNCGIKHKMRTHYCPKCGGRILTDWKDPEETVNICPVCGTTNLAESNFCFICGYHLRRALYLGKIETENANGKKQNSIMGVIIGLRNIIMGSTRRNKE